MSYYISLHLAQAVLTLCHHFVKQPGLIPQFSFVKEFILDKYHDYW